MLVVAKKFAAVLLLLGVIGCSESARLVSAKCNKVACVELHERTSAGALGSDDWEIFLTTYPRGRLDKVARIVNPDHIDVRWINNNNLEVVLTGGKIESFTSSWTNFNHPSGRAGGDIEVRLIQSRL